MKKYLLIIAMTALAGSFTACSDDDLGPSIFDTTSPQRTGFDLWLLNNYVYQYNIEYIYKWNDAEYDFEKNLVPADEENAELMAKILKHYWLEAYDEATNDISFMRTYGPKVILLVGSYSFNNDGTVTLGQAESGMKVTIFEGNYLQSRLNNIDQLNERYFKTMHHEFAHILHQTKNYPQQEYDNISLGRYTQNSWVNVDDEDVWPDGFVTAYGSKEPREDFVEVIANYLVKPESWWNNMLDNAGEFGRSAILQKLQIIREWLDTAWGIDIDHLKTIITRRGEELKYIL